MTFLRLAVLLISFSLLSSLSAFAADKAEQPLSGEDMKLAREMNEAYARHIYTSSCLNRQVGLFMPKMLTPEEKAKKIKSFKASCDCLADMVLKEATPNSVIDYVTRTSGTNKSVPDAGKKAKDVKKVLERTQEFDRIGLISRGKETRKMCGFNQ